MHYPNLEVKLVPVTSIKHGGLDEKQCITHVVSIQQADRKQLNAAREGLVARVQSLCRQPPKRYLLCAILYKRNDITGIIL